MVIFNSKWSSILFECIDEKICKYNFTNNEKSLLMRYIQITNAFFSNSSIEHVEVRNPTSRNVGIDVYKGIPKRLDKKYSYLFLIEHRRDMIS